MAFILTLFENLFIFLTFLLSHLARGFRPWIKRVHVLTDKYGCTDMQVETSETGIKLIRKFEKEVKAKVSTTSEEMRR